MLPKREMSNACLNFLESGCFRIDSDNHILIIVPEHDDDSKPVKREVGQTSWMPRIPGFSRALLGSKHDQQTLLEVRSLAAGDECRQTGPALRASCDLHISTSAN